MPPMIAILAAGGASRMRGADKCLEEIEGQPLLRVLAARALATGLPVMVSLPPGRHARIEALHGLDLARIEVPDADQGMSASFRAIAERFKGRPVLVMLGDMPEIDTEDLRKICGAFAAEQDRVVRASTHDGKPGQPVLFPPRIVSRFAGLRGDQGARSLLIGEDIQLVRLAGKRAVTDLDTPEDWAAWRKTRADNVR